MEPRSRTSEGGLAPRGKGLRSAPHPPHPRNARDTLHVLAAHGESRVPARGRKIAGRGRLLDWKRGNYRKAPPDPPKWGFGGGREPGTKAASLLPAMIDYSYTGRFPLFLGTCRVVGGVGRGASPIIWGGHACQVLRGRRSFRSEHECFPIGGWGAEKAWGGAFRARVGIPSPDGSPCV